MVGVHEGSKHSIEIRNALHKCKTNEQIAAVEFGTVILYEERKIFHSLVCSTQRIWLV